MAAPGVKKAARIAVKILLGLVLLLALVIGGVLIWLRTEHAEQLVVSLLTEQLADVGLTVEIGSFSGPMPQHLHVRDFRLADAGGTIATVRELTLELKLLPLLGGTLEVSNVSIAEPVLFRLPDLPQSDEPQPEPEAAAAPASNPLLLPVGIKLVQLELSNGQLASAVAFEDFQELGLPEFFGIAAQAALHLETGVLTGLISASALSEEREFISARIEAVRGGIRLFDPDSALLVPDDLNVLIEAGELPGGLVARFTGLDLPAYGMRLAGQGPVNAWMGTLSLSAGTNNHEDPNLLLLGGTLELACRTGSLWHDFIGKPNWAAQLEARLSPGSKAPREIAELVGNALSAVLSVNMKGADISAAASLEAPAWKLSIENAGYAQARNGFDATARLAAELTDISLLARLGLLDPADLPVRLGPASLQADVQASQRSLPSQAVFGRTDPPSVLTARSTGTLIAQLDGTPLPLRWRLEAEQAANRQSVTLHEMEALGITARGNARLGTDGGLNAELRLAAPDNAPWQTLLSRIFAMEGDLLRGRVELDAAWDQPPSGEDPHLSVELTGSGLHLPEGPARQLAGDSVSLKADATGLYSGNYDIRLHDLSAGGLRADGHFLYAAGDSMSAELSAAVDELAALEGMGLSGPLTAQLLAQGSLEAVEAIVSLESERLGTSAGFFENTRAGLNGRLNLAESYAGSGVVRLDTQHGQAGPFTLSSFWTFSMPGGRPPSGLPGGLPGELAAGPDNGVGSEQVGALSFSLTELSAEGLGIELQGSLSGAAPGLENDPVRLDGSLHAAVEKWTAIAALLQLPVNLGAATADITLSGAESPAGPSVQAAQASLTLKRISLPGSTALSVSDIEASFAARDLFGNPDISLSAQTAQGNAGPLRWDMGAIDVQGTAGSGQFSARLAANPGQAPSSQSPSQSARPGASPQPVDKLRVSGAYDLPSSSVTLSEALLTEPSVKAALELEQPFSLHYAEGIEAQGIRMRVQPSGTLTADISARPGAMEISADIQKLSLGLFQLLTDAPLPEGELDAGLSYRVVNAVPEAQASVNLRVTQPSGLSGEASRTALEAELEARLEAVPGQVSEQASALASAQAGALQGGGRVVIAPVNSETQTEIPAGIISFSLPLHIGPDGTPAPDMENPLSAEFIWSGPVDTLWQFMPMPGQELTGFASIDAALSGSLSAPEASGVMYLAGGQFQDTLNGILLRDLALEGHAGHDGTVTLLLSGKDAYDGSLQFEATAFSLFSDPVLVARGQMLHLQPLQRDDLSITLSGLVGVTGPLNALVIATDILVERGELDIASASFGGSVSTLEISEEAGEIGLKEGGPTLAVQIEIPRYFFVRGHGLDSEWSGSFNIRGPVSQPELFGALRPVRGQFDLLSKAFAFSGGEISFTGGRRINPAINLDLTYTGGSITAIAKASGTLSRPSISLESRPPLPQDEVLSHVLFGKSMSDLSHFEALQLANGVRELANIGSGGLNVLGSMRKGFGLDVLRIGGSADSGSARQSSGLSGAEDMIGPASSSGQEEGENLPSLEAGKYITDNIYVGVEQGFTQESTAVRIEIELMPRVTLEGRTSTSSSRVGIGWKKDY